MRLNAYLSIQHRKWQGIQKNHRLMKQLILDLMENPLTEPEHLAQAHAMYADTCKALHAVSWMMENYLRTGVKPTAQDVNEHYPKIREVTCSCGETYSVFEDGKWHRCPACGML